MTTPVQQWSDEAFIRLMKDLIKQEKKDEPDTERKTGN